MDLGIATIELVEETGVDRISALLEEPLSNFAAILVLKARRSRYQIAHSAEFEVSLRSGSLGSGWDACVAR